MTIDLDQLANDAVSELDIKTPSMGDVTRTVALRKRNRILGGVAAAVLLVVCGAWFLTTLENDRVSIDGVANQGDDAPSSGASGPAGVAVPDVVGLSEAEARRVLEESGFLVSIVVIDGVESGDIVSGEVAETEPRAGSVAEAGSSIDVGIAAGETVGFEKYDDPKLRTQSYYPLIPSPESLGEGWEQFSGLGMNRFVLFDPEEEEASTCDVAEPIVVNDGFFAEYGFGESPDDGLILIARGDSAYLESLFRDFGQLVTCTEDGLGAVVTIKDPPPIPGALEVLRFFSTDDLGQDSENLLIVREDLLLFLGVSEQGGQQADIDQLARDALNDYDAST